MFLPRLTRLAILTVCGTLLASGGPAAGQTELPYIEPLPFGTRYGMNRPLFPIPQGRSYTESRRAVLLNYYRQRRARVSRNPLRTASPFGVFGGLESRRSRFQSGRAIYPRNEYNTPLGPITQERYEAFRTYGGFRHRTLDPTVKPGDVTEALRRRTTLVEATGLYAPIQRANLQHASVAGLRASLDLAPLPVPELPPDVADASPHRTLADELMRNTQRARARKLQEAWAAFRQADYRQAIHGFKAAADLGDDDTETEIAQMFCYVSLGAPRSAIAVLARLARRGGNPFLASLNMAERYGRRVDVDILKARARFQASAAQDNAALLALSTMMFWYLGDVEEARSTAASLRAQAAGTVFADWPSMLEEALPSRTAPVGEGP